MNQFPGHSLNHFNNSTSRWRLLIPFLPKETPLFIPDLPGYGGSGHIPQNDKLSQGNALLGALSTELKRTTTSNSSSPTPIVLIGHDRGARIAHRLTVTGHPDFSILGVTLIDIVPTSIQWQNNASPSQAAKAVTGYWHWPFLANVDLATRMITAYGGAKWVQEMTIAWAGKNPTGLEKLRSDDSLNVYGGYFEREDTIRATCDDYKHGASTDLEEQEKDQKEGRKIDVPLLLIYGADFIGKRYNFGETWQEWVGEGVEITDCGLKNGIGHFGAEEAPEETAEAILGWLKGLKGVDGKL